MALNLTSPPTAPSRSDPSTFSDRADQHLDWLSTFHDELNALNAADWFDLLGTV